MKIKLLSRKRILSEMLLQRVCGYTFNRDVNIGLIPFQARNRLNNVIK